MSVSKECGLFNDVLVALLPFLPNMSFKFWERYHGGDGALVAGRLCDYSEVAGRAATTLRSPEGSATTLRSPEGLRLL